MLQVAPSSAVALLEGFACGVELCGGKRGRLHVLPEAMSHTGAGHGGIFGHPVVLGLGDALRAVRDTATVTSWQPSFRAIDFLEACAGDRCLQFVRRERKSSKSLGEC